MQIRNRGFELSAQPARRRDETRLRREIGGDRGAAAHDALLIARLVPLLLEVLTPALADQLTLELAPRLIDALQVDDRWLTTREAAEYLGMTPNALHRLTAERSVPFSQDRPGGKCYFRRSELNAWRRGGAA